MSTQLAVVSATTGELVQVEEWTDARKEFIRKAFCGGAPDDIAATFLGLCERRRLSPEARHVYLVNRAPRDKTPNWVIQTGIDGYRLIADRTGRYAGCDDPVFQYSDDRNSIVRATVTVYKMVSGQRCPFTASARWDEYSAGSPMWNKMPHTMIAKCAEALALRKAFPEELSGMYTDVEMDQAESPAPHGARLHEAASDAPESPQSDVPMITDKQIKMIQGLKTQKGLTDAAVKELHGKASAKTLTRREASALIDKIQSYPDIVLDEDPEADAFIDGLPLGDSGNDRWTR